MQSTEGRVAIFGLVLLGTWIFVILPLIHFPWTTLVTDASGSKFAGLDNTAWTAISAIANSMLAFLTLGLLVFAVYQVLTVKRDAKTNRTLAACERYDIDPVLDQITRRLENARDDGSLRQDPTKYAVDLDSLFNYFESIAIGVARGHYDPEIVRDQFEVILSDHIEHMAGIKKWSQTGGEDDIQHFDKMMALYTRWKRERDA